MGNEISTLYDEHYHKQYVGSAYTHSDFWLGIFDRVAEQIVNRLAPRSVFDAGCAIGLLVETLRDRGVEAWGVDISEYAISQVRPDMRPYCSVGSVTTPLTRSYDLISCIEVLEHLSPCRWASGHSQLLCP